ncbi:hypothetical protein J5500_01890 [Candidatus Saccharibacteria bacterium]|nr:hypothetical protein [Candidatus Saccharibacteria bacterium]
MKKLSFASGVAAIALAAASIFPAAGVFANTVASTDYTGNPVTLTRTVSGVTNNVTNTFGYTITNTSTPTGGSVTNAPTAASIVFSNTAPSGTPAAATQSTTVDFSAANYSKVGDYEFTIHENSSTDATNYPIDAEHNDYKAVVQVRYYTDGSNVPDNTRYVATIYIKDKNGDKVTSGVATWGSAAARTYIEVEATTTGNMADTNECFAYTINIPAGNGVVAGDHFTIVSNSTCQETSATSVTAGTPATVYLKHGESLTVGVNNGANELPVGAKYTITKTNASDDYIEKFDGSTASSSGEKTTVAVPTPGDTAAEAAFDANNHTDIENNLQSNPLTGIVTNFWFYLVLLIIGAFGFIIFMRKRQDDEEERQQA